MIYLEFIFQFKASVVSQHQTLYFKKCYFTLSEKQTAAKVNFFLLYP